MTPSKDKPTHATSTPTNSNNGDDDDIEKEIMRLGEDSDEVYKMLTGGELMIIIFFIHHIFTKIKLITISRIF